MTTIKAFGNAPWHSKAAHEEEHQISTPVDLKEVAKVVQKEEEPPKPIVDTAALQQESTSVDKNLIQIEFSHLDGKEDRSGLVVIKLIPEWAPIGVERFKELTAASFWEACRAFRVIPNFVVQLGINGNPEVQKFWRDKSIKDDEVKTTNARGTITFATSGANTRTSQIFFNIGKNNKYLDRQGFAPIGQVIKGMEIIDRIYAGYKEGPDQGMYALFLSCSFDYSLISCIFNILLTRVVIFVF